MAARAQSGAEASTSAPDPLSAVKREFPCREQIIDQLAVVMMMRGKLEGVACLVHGPHGAGKTAVVRGLLSALRLRHAYVNCHESTRPRPLLCSVLHQLKGGKRQRDDGYDTGIKCASVAEFKMQLPGVVGRRRQACWLVLDNAQRLASTDLLAALLRVGRETGAGTRLGVILIADDGGWARGQYFRDTVLVLPPREIEFPEYQPKQLQQILERQREQVVGSGGDMPAYRQFLSFFVPAFCRASNNLLHLKAGVAQLFPLYMQPLLEGRQVQASQLYARIKSQVQECIRELQMQGQWHGSGQSSHGLQLLSSEHGGIGVDAAAEDLRSAAGRRACSSGLSFELPYVSKFLLLAAYVASRNRATSDRDVFDPTYHKRGRKDAQAHDRRVEAAVEATLRGPHSFPLERLLHIFYALYAHHDAEDEEEEEEAGEQGRRVARHQAQRMMQQAEVLQQVSSLVALRVMEHCGGDVLEGQLYRCNLSQAAAEALAANVCLRLTDYLRPG